MNKINNYKNKYKIYSINIKKAKTNTVLEVFIIIVLINLMNNRHKIEIK
jgi:hypothetical protein